MEEKNTIIAFLFALKVKPEQNEEEKLQLIDNLSKDYDFALNKINKKSLLKQKEELIKYFNGYFPRKNELPKEFFERMRRRLGCFGLQDNFCQDCKNCDIIMWCNMFNDNSPNFLGEKNMLNGLLYYNKWSDEIIKQLQILHVEEKE